MEREKLCHDINVRLSHRRVSGTCMLVCLTCVPHAHWVTQLWEPSQKVGRGTYLWVPLTDIDQRNQHYYLNSLRASSPIWASETSLARTRERAAKPRGAEERRACNHPLQIFICTSPRRREISLAEKWRSGNQSWLITGQAGTRFVCVSNLVLRGIRLVPRTCFSPQCRRARLL